MAFGNASSSPAPTSRMKPARQTSCDVPGLQFGRERPIEVVPRLELAVIHHQRLDACIPRVLEPRRLRAVGDDYRNARVEPAVADASNQRLHIAAAAGNQDAESICSGGRRWSYRYRTPAPS